MSVMQMMVGSALANLVTWDPANLSPHAVLSNGNRTLKTNAASSAMARSLTSKATGKWYAEAILDNANPNAEGMGIANASWAVGVTPGFGTTSIGWFWDAANAAVYYNSVVIANLPAATGLGDLLQMGVDATARKLYLGKNNVWLGGCDPVAGTGGLTISPTGALYLTGYVQNVADSFSLQGGTAGVVPAGYSKWD